MARRSVRRLLEGDRLAAFEQGDDELILIDRIMEGAMDARDVAIVRM